MYRWNAKIGLLLHPVSDSDSVKISKHHIVDTEGCIIKMGFPIPMSAETFTEFANSMKKNEAWYLQNINKYSFHQ
jgi:hypothetical protein